MTVQFILPEATSFPKERKLHDRLFLVLLYNLLCKTFKDHSSAFAKHGDVFYKVDIPKIDVVNPVGSGDSTVAGIASGLYHHESDADLLKKANVLGMLNAQEAQTGHVNMGHYDALYQQLIVKEV